MSIISIFLKILPAFLTALLISSFVMPAIIKVASLKNLIDAPDEGRKRHKGFIPTLGGVGIFTGFLISFSVWGGAGTLISYPYFVASIFMLFLIGIIDDILGVSPLKKLGVQFLAAAEIVIGGKVAIANLGGVFGIYHMSPTVSVVLTISVFIILINSYNLIDGIDGLAGGVGIMISTLLGAWFLAAGQIALAVLAFALAGALIGFLAYNFHPAKIFMGDTGAMAVGFIIIYMMVQFITLNYANPVASYHINNAAVFALALFILPVIDTLRIFILRVINGNNPMVGDFNHIHHQFLKKGISPAGTSYCLWAGNLGIVYLAHYFSFANPNLLLLMVLMSGFLLLPICKAVHSLVLKIAENYYPRYYRKLNNSNI